MSLELQEQTTAYRRNRKALDLTLDTQALDKASVVLMLILTNTLQHPTYWHPSNAEAVCMFTH